MTSRSIFSIPLLCAAVGLTAIFISGCDEVDNMADNAANRPANVSGVGVVTDDGSTTRQPKQAAPADANNQATAPAAQPDPNAPTTLQPGQENDPNLVKAEPGVGKQGQDYGGGALMAPITTPVREFFGMRDRVNFDMIKHDMDIYHAIHNRYPKDTARVPKGNHRTGQPRFAGIAAGKSLRLRPENRRIVRATWRRAKVALWGSVVIRRRVITMESSNRDWLF